MQINWSPSLMLIDILHLQEQVDELTKVGSTSFHIDIMDGNYVPNITLGLMDIIALNKISPLPLEIHLMVNEPSNILHLFNLDKVSIIMIHPETCTHLHRTINQIKSMGKRVGLVLNPSTPISCAEELIQDLDVVMIMSVNPGFAGQAFIHASIEKTQRLYNILSNYQKKIDIMVDGSISPSNIAQLVKCGATGFVLGSAGIFYDQNNFKKNIDLLKDAIKA